MASATPIASDRLAVHPVDEYAFSVPDLQQARHFYTSFGLDVRDEDGALTLYFRYVRDTWGSYAEYSFDIDFVEPGAEWPAADHPGEDSLYVWGSAVPEDFIVNDELPAP